MKKFIKLMLCFCLCVISFAFSGCGMTGKIDAPDANETVYSNGGSVVRKGDYVYFANGYSSIQAIVDGETKLKKSYSRSNLAVAELEDNGKFDRTKNGSLEEMDSLTKRLAGFEATDLHIFGNYIYFTTVNTEKNKNGGTQVQKLIVRRMKLTGGSSEKVYSSKINYVDSEGNRVVNFYYFEQEGNVYLLINENGTLKRVECSNNEIDNVEKVANDVLSLVVPEEDVNNMDGIFFLTTDEDGRSVINRYNIVEDKIITKKTLSDDDKVDSLFASKFGNLYFYATFDEEGASYLYYLTHTQFENVSISYNNCEANRILHDTSTKIYLLENMIDGILAVDSNEVKIIDHRNPSTILTKVDDLSSSANIVLVDNGWVYYYSDKEICAWNYLTNETNKIITETNTICDYHFDLVDNYLYYFATCGENDYMFRVNVKIENQNSELMGVYTKADDPTIEEEKVEE